jgi:hypothetical protein
MLTYLRDTSGAQTIANSYKQLAACLLRCEAAHINFRTFGARPILFALPCKNTALSFSQGRKQKRALLGGK